MPIPPRLRRVALTPQRPMPTMIPDSQAVTSDTNPAVTMTKPEASFDRSDSHASAVPRRISQPCSEASFGLSWVHEWHRGHRATRFEASCAPPWDRRSL